MLKIIYGIYEYNSKTLILGKKYIVYYKIVMI